MSGTFIDCAQPDKQWRSRSRQHGLTLMETALILVIGGLLVQLAVYGSALITNSRVKELMAQRGATEAAVVAFRDRYRALPGDFDRAGTSINCGVAQCLNGNGNGRVEAAAGESPAESILSWHHLAASGLIMGNYQYSDMSVSEPNAANTPTNIYGGYLQLSSDTQWGYPGGGVVRDNLKTGNRVPANVLAEVDQKIDDGRPGSGKFQFSSYGLVAAGSGSGTCTVMDSAAVQWNIKTGPDDCGGATLIN